jgi:hypothetical protein
MADGSGSSSPSISSASTTSAALNGAGAPAGSLNAGWFSALLPSVSDLVFIGVLCSLIFTPLAVKLLGDAGIGWHIRTGQEILSTHAIPHADSFSSSMSGKPWFAWEWLYDILVALFARVAGLNAVAWFTSVVIAAVFAWMFRLLVRREMNFIFALLLVLFTLSASTIHFLARPHVVSWLFTLAFFWVLDSTERNYFKGVGRHRKLWALPLLMIVWVNVHGGFVIGFVLLAVFWFGSIWTWYRTKGTGINQMLHRIAAAKRVGDLTRVGLASLLASFLNPYGWNLHAHIFSYLTNRFLMGHIEEFQSPNFHGVAQKCFLILLLMSLGVLVTRGRRLRTSEGLLVLFVTYAGLFASRNIPISSILLVMIVGPWLPSSGVLDRFSLRMSAVELGLRAHVWPILVAIATLAIAANGGRLGSNVLIDAHFDPNRMPVAAVNYLEQHDLHSPILSPDFWGGYLIYRLYPTAQVVVDDRHDLYGADFLQSYLKLIHVERGWDEFLRQQNPACIVLPRNGSLASILSTTPEWKTVYSDNLAMVFVRAAESR